MSELYGRAALLEDVVPSLVGLAPHGRKRITPPRRGYPCLITCVGGRGTGKSAVLAALSEQYAQRVPQARADLAAGDFGQPGLAALAEDDTANASRVSDLLFYLHERLSRKPAAFGRSLTFPRLTQGLLAVSSWQAEGSDAPGSTVTPQELAAAKRRLAELLRASQPDAQRRKDRAAAWTDQVIDVAVPMTGLPPGLDVMVQTLLQIVSTELLGPRAHGGGLAWWAGRRVTQQGAAQDQLTELAMKFRGDADDRRLAERHLIAALLADVTDYYGVLQRLNAVPRPLLLLDNVHSPLGQVFLDELMRVWHAESAGSERVMWPAVVTTALRDAPPVREDDRGPSTRRATGSFWRDDRPGSVSDWAVSLPLAELDLDEVKRMFGQDRPPDGTARLVVRLSGGRAMIAHTLAAAVARRLRLSERPTVAGLLDTPAATAPERTVCAVLLERLIPDEVARRRLVYYAAALDDDAAHRLGALYPPQDPGGVPVQESKAHLRANRWSRLPWPGTEGPFVGDPVLRPLLLHELGARTGASPAAETWKNIHLRLRSLYDPHDRGGAAARPDTRYLHHSLALGETDLVVRSLHRRFGEHDARDWLAALNLVCAAPLPPRALPPPPPNAAPCPACPTEHDAVHHAVERLVHQLWQLSQPLAPPDDTAINSIGLHLGTLAQRSGDAEAEAVFFRAHEQWPRELRGWIQAPHLPTYGESRT